MDFLKLRYVPKPQEPLTFSSVSDVCIVHKIDEAKTKGTNKTYWWVTAELKGRKFTASCWNEPSAKPGSQIEAKVTVKGDFTNIEILSVYETPVVMIPVDKYEAAAFEVIKRVVADATNPMYKFVHHGYVKYTLTEYKKHRAATKVHHYYPGAMIEHVYEMLSFYEGLLRTGNLAPHNSAIVVLAIIFHDWGKIVCHPETTDYNPMQYLFNHVYVSTAQVQAWLDPAVKEDPSILTDYLNLLHCILAHHKVLEHGSPVVPITVEAVILIAVDKLSADLNMMKNAVPGEYNKYMGGNLYPNPATDFGLEYQKPPQS